MNRSIESDPRARPSAGAPPCALLVGGLAGEAWVLSEWLREGGVGGAPMELLEASSLEAALDMGAHEARLELCFVGAGLGETAILRFLRQARAFPSLPEVVLLATRAQEPLVIEALSEGAGDYLLREDLAPSSLRRTVRLLRDLRAARLQSAVARRESRWSQAQAEALFESATDGAILVRRDGRVESANRVALAMLGASEEDLVGRELERLRAGFVDGEGKPIPLATFPPGLSLLEGQPAGLIVFAVRQPAESRRPLALRSRPIFADGERPGVLVTLTEVGDAQGAGPLRMLAQVAPGIAHDLNNMLHAVLAGSELLRRSLPPESPDALLAEQVESAARAARKLSGRLAAAAREQAIPERAVDIDLLIRDAEDLLRLVAGKSVRLTFEPGSGGATVWGDPGELEQVLLNLIVNARDAMPGGGEIVVRSWVAPAGERARARGAARPAEGLSAVPAVTSTVAGEWPGADNDAVVVEVFDNGGGMDAATAARAFEPFFSTKGAAKGKGLGLAIVRSVLDRLGGVASLSSELGRGTRVAVTLPRKS